MRIVTVLFVFNISIGVCSIRGTVMPAKKAFSEETEKVFKFLQRTTPVNLIFDQNEDFNNKYIDFFVKSAHYPLIIVKRAILYSVKIKFNESEKNENFIVKSSIETLKNDLSIFTFAKGFNILIIEDTLVSNPEQIRRHFEYAWKQRGSLNVYVISGNNIFTYNPFAFDDILSEYGQVILLKNRNSYDEIFKDLNGYPMRIEIFKSVYSLPIYNGTSKEVLYYKGVDMKVTETLKNQMNFSIVLYPEDGGLFGDRQPDGTYTGAIGRLINKTTDISLTGFFIKDYLTRKIEFSTAVYTDKLCCFVTKAERVPQSILPLFSLSFNMWMCFIFTALVCGTIWCAIRYANIWLAHQGVSDIPVPSNKVQYIEIFVDTFIVWVRVGLEHFPVIISERLFVISISLVSVIFGALFESSLATVYIKPLYYKDINTLQELDQSGFKIKLKYKSMMDDLFPNTSSPLFASLCKKMILIGSTKLPLIEIMARDGGFAGVTRDSTISLENVKYFALKKIHRIPICPKDYTIAYGMPFGSTFETRINTLLLRFLNAGLINKWIEEMFFEARITKIRFFDQDSTTDNSFKILTLNDLQLAFYVIFAGSILSTIVLGLEHYSMKNK